MDLSRLRFALVHDWLTVPAGSEEVFAEIVDLFPGTVFTSQWDPARVKFIQHLEVRTSLVDKLPFSKTRHFLYAPFLAGVYRRMDLTGFDVILSDSHSFAHGVCKAPGALHINYYHTPARSLWVPEIDRRASKTFLHRLIARRLRKLDLEASRRPDILVANSGTTAKRIERFYGRKVDRVIYPPVHTQKWLQVPRIGTEEGLIYWGRLIGYKRVDLAIEAVRRTEHKLHIVGGGPLEAQLRQQAAANDRVIFHGRLPDEQLWALMSRAHAVVFPAYEDFGIVPVEAMAAGLPVVAFGAGGATETVTPGMGLLFKEQSADALEAALRQLDRETFDEEKLREHARTFDVSRFRAEYQDLVVGAIASKWGDG
jgi:glycosyltransferase involved in cell wall biosynthesis